MFGLLLPLCVPILMASFSALTVAAKWLVVGRYWQGVIHIDSLAFLRW
jgi:hypothetical protein